MNTEKYIEKNDPASTEPTFFKLKQEGIRILQDLSANQWTDYNLHDPGVTILEQLCYALTELIYKSGYKVEDYLVDKDLTINYERLAIYLPKFIYPSIPVTINDYRKYLYDCSSDIVDIWITPLKNKKYSGLYSLLVQPRNRYADDKEKIAEIKDQIRHSFCRNRNLCEDIDLDEIHIVKVKKIEISADIEIDHSNEPESIMAEIYFKVSKFLNPGIIYHSFTEIAGQGMPVDEILSGPLLKHGWINDDELMPVMKTIFSGDLMQVIDKVQGVKSVSSLFLMVDGIRFPDEYTIKEDDTVPVLAFPNKPEEIRVSLRKDQRVIKIDVKKMQGVYRKMDAQRWNVYNSIQNPDSLFEFPEGTFYNFRDYYSIQHNFPINYGINAFGLAESEPEKRKIQAKQLKAYLLVFEQLLANFQEQISHIKDLFSVDPHINHTYFSQPLLDIPNIGGLYLHDTYSSEQIRELTVRSDKFSDRRNRFLDYLLSLYGEDFKQKSLRRYNYYHEGEEFEQELIDNKIAFLKTLVNINKNRSRAFNYLEQSWETGNISGLKHKVMLLLGIRNIRQVSYSHVFLNRGFRLVSEHQYEKIIGHDPYNTVKKIVFSKEYIEEHFNPVPLMKVKDDPDFEGSPEFIADNRIFINNIIIDTFLRFGVSLNNFRIGTDEESKNIIAVFWHPVKNEWQYVSEFKDIHTAQEKINRVRKFLIRLNQESEGLYIVENILLRPESETGRFSFGITGIDGKELFQQDRTFSMEDMEKLLSELALRFDEPDVFRIQHAGEQSYRIHLYLSEEEILKGKHSYKTHESASAARDVLLDFLKGSLEEHELELCFSRYSLRGEDLFIPEDFYSQKISVIFPDWTARFYNSNFRMLAEETVSGNTPAHIFPEFYWLNPENMEKFEKLYWTWLEEKRQSKKDQIETAAVNLISFLLDHERSGNIYT